MGFKATGRSFEQKTGRRFEVVKVGERFVILDGAHNPEALENLVQTWKASPWSQKKSLWLLGLMKDKDAKAALKKIAPYVRSLLIVSPPNPRALNAETLAALARRLVPHAFVAASQSVEEAVAIWHNGDAKTLVVCGSFYLVAPLRSALSALNKKEENSFYEKK